MIAFAPAPDPFGGLSFRRRKESWVAESDGRFYKIARRGEDPLQDLDDPACIAVATREYDDLCFLHALDPAVCLPAHIDRACVVYPLLSGPDLRTLLLHPRGHAEHDPALRSVMQLLARLHRGDSSGYPVKDYAHENFLAPTPALLARMRNRPRTLVVTGFEARNFRFDATCHAWRFFDPHHVWRGCPEEDFARFVVSLLMLPGRRRGPRTWAGFDRFRLLAAYEASAPAPLDRLLLNYFLAEKLAMRRFHALRSARRSALAVRPIGVAYTRLYYQRMQSALARQHF